MASCVLVVKKPCGGSTFGIELEYIISIIAVLLPVIPNIFLCTKKAFASSLSPARALGLRFPVYAIMVSLSVLMGMQ